jgi:hypothetical protein
MGTHRADGASGATGYQRGSKDPRGGRFCFGKGKAIRGRGGEPRLARERNLKAKGRTLVLLQLRHTQDAQPPHLGILLANASKPVVERSL